MSKEITLVKFWGYDSPPGYFIRLDGYYTVRYNGELFVETGQSLRKMKKEGWNIKSECPEEWIVGAFCTKQEGKEREENDKKERTRTISSNS